MADPTITPEPSKDPVVDPVVPKQDPNEITLSREDYNNLLKNNATLQSQVSQLLERLTPPEEESEPTPKEDDVEFDKMTPKQFYDYIKNSIGGPIMTAVTAVGIRQEMNDVQKEHPDFKDFKEDIRAYMMKNPFSSVLDAYTLVKARKGNVNTPANEPKPAESPKGPIPGGEKPGPAAATVKAGDPKTMREAVELAAKDVFK